MDSGALNRSAGCGRLTKDSSTIAAIATPPGSGGIGIIKISGPEAFSIAGSIFQRSGSEFKSPINPDHPSTPFLQSHHLYYGHIVVPDDGIILDEVLLTCMRAPHTYTREDIVEIQAHAGYVVLKAIFDLVLHQGARVSEPGEFTKRAFLNGRIDLTQAEAIIDIINAKTEKALAHATQQIKGKISQHIESIKKSLIEIMVEIEAAIDFPDDIDESVSAGKFVIDIENKVINKLKALLDQYHHCHVLRDGLKMVVVGRPNVGKSSLMNRLLQKDRVIVTSIPGTTRDLIEEAINIQGIPVILADSAGLHDTDDPVEVIGIKKTQEYINSADLILFVIDGSDPLTNADYRIYDDIYGMQTIIVQNKSDLVKDGLAVNLPDAWKDIPRVATSALYNNGIDSLKKLIVDISMGGFEWDIRNTIIPNVRHKIALERTLHAALAAEESVRSGTPFELIAIDIKAAIDALGEILGETTGEDILDQIFSRFCIGK
ncbi:tRNA uridine-5-carboxymethylaminomethyl(34) synthesis GTPase MnmE [Thermodesulfobacteriota bacterium]